MTTMNVKEIRSRRKMGKVDYEQAKSDFMKLVKLWLNNQGSAIVNYDLYSKETINNIKYSIMVEMKHNPKYEVVQKKGKNILVLRRNHILEPGIQVLSWEEMFDLFMPLHIESGHKGRDFLMSKVSSSEYKFPFAVLTFFTRICNVCNRSAGRYTLSGVSRCALVYVINMVQMRNDEQFRYILIYVDRETNYILIRPLMAKTDLEISTELLKIFTQFGPPSKLQLHGYNMTLTQNVGLNLRKICPGFKISIEHKPVSYELPTQVIDKIDEWMKKNNSSVWEVGCSIVQSQMNHDPKMRPRFPRHCEFKTPHALLFHINSERNETAKTKETIKRTNLDASPEEEQEVCGTTKRFRNSSPTQSNFINVRELNDDSFNQIEETQLTNDPISTEVKSDKDSQDSEDSNDIKSEIIIDSDDEAPNDEPEYVVP